jgi:hypothetical protein
MGCAVGKLHIMLAGACEAGLRLRLDLPERVEQTLSVECIEKGPSLAGRAELGLRVLAERSEH